MPPTTARQPWTRYRPIRAFDSGGYEETLDDPVDLWATESIHQDQLRLEVDINEDVLVGDILAVDETVGRF